MAEQTQASAPPTTKSDSTPFLRQAKREDVNLQKAQKILQNRKQATNPFQWVAHRVQDVNLYFLQQLGNDAGNFLREELPKVIAKATVGGAALSFSPSNAKQASEDAFKALTLAVMQLPKFFQGVAAGMETDRRAEETFQSSTANGLAIINAEPKTLNANQQKWGQMVKDMATKANTTEAAMVDFIARQNQLYIQHG
jgi:hypothetical protein